MNTVILKDIDISALIKVQKKFKQFNQNVKNDKDKTAVLKVFEFCYELSWKTLKRVIKKISPKTINCSKDIFKFASIEGLIDNPQVWFDFIDLKNKVIYCYDDAILATIYSHMPLFEKELDSLIERLLKLK